MTIKVANAPCSWGALEFDLDSERPGYQRVLDEIAQSGYVGTELGDWGFMPTDPKELQQELQQRKLSMLAAFVPIDFSDRSAHEAGAQIAIKTARLLSQVSETPFIVLADENGKNAVRTKNAGRITPQQGLSADQWQIYARGVEYVAKEVLKETGVKSVFHHHCAGFVETPSEVETLLSLTDPLLVGLCLDTGHYWFGGGNALDALKKHRERIWHVHFKDFDPAVARQAQEQGWGYFESVSRGVFCELGKGVVAFPQLVDELRQNNYTGWIVVEQDVLPGMGSPLESAHRNRKFLQHLGL